MGITLIMYSYSSTIPACDKQLGGQTPCKQHSSRYAYTSHGKKHGRQSKNVGWSYNVEYQRRL